ncbi:hypothetical protein SAMN04489724_1705 [Algoriphagus locisalis]|uniref:Uncharacterized protein n=1 Tax=Algoriphagus locisalis TaxID=305507 RepID=A0A1I7A6F5_9BACT|nr:hypothetical protein SAMN04489724_1705 [Algoriphagus locisalis]
MFYTYTKSLKLKKEKGGGPYSPTHTVRIIGGGNEFQNHSNGSNSQNRQNIQLDRNFKVFLLFTS